MFSKSGKTFRHGIFIGGEFIEIGVSIEINCGTYCRRALDTHSCLLNCAWCLTLGRIGVHLTLEILN
jgi:hypothetical protein